MKKEKNKNHLPRYGLRAMSWSISIASRSVQVLMMAYLTFYLTENVYLSAGLVGSIIALSRVFDGVSDLIAGFVVDKTNTRWGKARPYSWFIVVLWTATVFLFSVPDISITGKIIYIFILYNISETISNTMLFASENVHYKRAFNEDEQLDITGICGLVAGVISMAVSIVLPVLVENIGSKPGGWTIIALTLAIPGSILGLSKFFFMPELNHTSIDSEKRMEKIGFKKISKTLVTNRYAFIVAAVTFLRQFLIGLAITTYYFKYMVGSVALASLTSMFGLVSMLIMPFVPKLSRKLGIRKFTSLFIMMSALSQILVFLAPTNMVILCISSGITSLGSLPVGILTAVMLIQTMKYSEWKDGISIDGVISSINGFATKVGLALGAIFTGFMLSLSGYSGMLDVQPNSAVTMIKFLYAGAPLIIYLICTLLLSKFDLEKKLPQIEKELAERQ